jgi:hypothetical protein
MTWKSALTRPGQTLAFAATGVMAAAAAAEPAIVELQPDSPRHELDLRFFAANVDLARERHEWIEDALAPRLCHRFVRQRCGTTDAHR